METYKALQKRLAEESTINAELQTRLADLKGLTQRLKELTGKQQDEIGELAEERSFHRDTSMREKKKCEDALERVGHLEVGVSLCLCSLAVP